MNLKQINVLFLLTSLVFISCVNKKEHSIKIYLLKERIDSNDGISISDIKNFKNLDNLNLKSISEIARYDTINKEFIYAGKFNVNENQINSNPLIKDSEIINLNLKDNKIELSASGANKILNLKSSMKSGVQFVICDNKKPLLTGYFWSTYSSYGSHWNSIEYNHTQGKILKNTFFNLYKGNGIDVTKRVNINFNEEKELINVFKETNRLTE